MKLETGKLYNVSELFINNENGKIVIPDLQRDYCWGNKGTLVKDFVRNLKKYFDEYQQSEQCDAKPLMMGMLYGYYETSRPYLQLCDGQQRLTTLFLLIGLINRKCENVPFKDILISKYELDEDDKEPNLLYSVRDSSLYFLSDLVCEFFLQKEIGTEEDKVSDIIKGSDWWFDSYKHDPTISSMLDAMDTIQSILKDTPNDELKLFGNYICEKLQFVFFDMGNRRNGEETFVIINTTGEPLSATENLKPILVTKGGKEKWKKQSRQWEEIDNWFWNNRDKENQDTSDKGMKEFLRWVAGIYSYKEQKGTNTDDYKLFTEDEYRFPDTISTGELYEAYKSLKDLVEQNVIQIDCLHKDTERSLVNYFAWLPTLWHHIKFSSSDRTISEQESKRVYRFFKNISRYTVISTENNNIYWALNTIEKMKDADICSLLDIESELNKAYILTEEEKIQLKIIRNYIALPDKREEIEDEFENISSHKVLEGEIRCLIKWSGGVENFMFEEFKKYVNIFKKVLPDTKREDVKDEVRRALLTREDMKYPRVLGNFTFFCWEWKDWKTLVYDNSKAFKGFFDDLLSGKTYKNMIDNYREEEKRSDFVHQSDFVRHDYLLDYCNTKQLRWLDDYGWNLVQNFRAKPFSVKNMCLYHELKEKFDGKIIFDDKNIDDWHFWQYFSINSCVVLEHGGLRIYFDISYIRHPEDDKYSLSVTMSKRERKPEEYEGLKDELKKYISPEITTTWNSENGIFVCEVNQMETLHKLIEYCTKLC